MLIVALTPWASCSSDWQKRPIPVKMINQYRIQTRIADARSADVLGACATLGLGARGFERMEVPFFVSFSCGAVWAPELLRLDRLFFLIQPHNLRHSAYAYQHFLPLSALARLWKVCVNAWLHLPLSLRGSCSSSGSPVYCRSLCGMAPRMLRSSSAENEFCVLSMDLAYICRRSCTCRVFFICVRDRSTVLIIFVVLPRSVG